MDTYKLFIAGKEQGWCENKALVYYLFAGKRLNLRPDQLFINSFHTHAGPEVRSSFNHKTYTPGEVGKPGSVYIDDLLEKIINSADKALKNLKPVEAVWGIGETFIGINRRAPDKSIYSQQAAGYENFPNPDKEIDRTCPVILFKDKKGKPISLVFGASCLLDIPMEKSPISRMPRLSGKWDMRQLKLSSFLTISRLLLSKKLKKLF